MIDVNQETVTAIMIPPAVYNSAHTAEYVDTQNFRYGTFIINLASASSGVYMKITKASDKSGTGAADLQYPLVGSVYYTNKASASKTSMVQTSITSSGSVGYIAVDSTAKAIYTGTIDFAKATSSSKAYISIRAKGNSASSMAANGILILHGNRYQNETGFNVLA
jgi:hypothetical protein